MPGRCVGLCRTATSVQPCFQAVWRRWSHYDAASARYPPGRMGAQLLRQAPAKSILLLLLLFASIFIDLSHPQRLHCAGFRAGASGYILVLGRWHSAAPSPLAWPSLRACVLPGASLSQPPTPLVCAPTSYCAAGTVLAWLHSGLHLESQPETSQAGITDSFWWVVGGAAPLGLPGLLLGLAAVCVRCTVTALNPCCLAGYAIGGSASPGSQQLLHQQQPRSLLGCITLDATGLRVLQLGGGAAGCAPAFRQARGKGCFAAMAAGEHWPLGRWSVPPARMSIGCAQ
jgi:hypothetical protein